MYWRAHTEQQITNELAKRQLRGELKDYHHGHFVGPNAKHMYLYYTMNAPKTKWQNFVIESMVTDTLDDFVNIYQRVKKITEMDLLKYE